METPYRNRYPAEDLAGRFLLQFLRHHRAADVIGDAKRLAQRGVGQHDRKLLAAVTCGNVLALDGLLQRHAD
jgi:hypothetical protein